MLTSNNKCFGEAFNIGAGGRVTILEMYTMIQTILGTNQEPEFGPVRPGDIPHSCADITKAKELLRYNPKIQFKEGLEKTVNYFLR